MTYFGFLLRFLVIPIAVMLAIHIWDTRRGMQIPNFRNGRAVWAMIFVHVALALVYTTPWDNYLVATGVWYYNPDLVTGIVFGYVPLEEYTFFVLETVLAGLWWWFLARRLRLPAPETFQPSRTGRLIAFGILFVVWAGFTVMFFSGWTPGTYLSIILFWALPAIFPQFLFGADILWHYRKLVLWTVLPLGTYLSLMDIIALGSTTWSISKSQTTGILFFGILPLEEILFFFVTNILIGFGITLMLSNLSHARLEDWKGRRFMGLP